MIIRFIRYCYLSMFAPIFFHIEGEVSITKKVTILMKAKLVCCSPFSGLYHALPPRASLLVWSHHLVSAFPDEKNQGIPELTRDDFPAYLLPGIRRSRWRVCTGRAICGPHTTTASWPHA
jgi:hypothetical protein